MGRSSIASKLISLDGSPAKKRCPKCTTVKPLTEYARDMSKSDNVTSWCKDCRSAERRRKRSIGMKEKPYIQDSQKVRAKAMLKYAIDNSLIIRPTKCAMCWKECNPEGHHSDYSQPYKVYWLCKDCHAFVHSRSREEIYNRIEEKYKE